MTTKQILLSAIILGATANIALADKKTVEQREQTKKQLQQEMLNEKFIYAATNWRDNMEEVKQLLQDGAEVNAKNSWGYTALHKAVDYRNLEVVKYLLENGAEVNTKNKCGEAPLHTVSDHSRDNENDLEVTLELIKNGADLDVQDNKGYTPAHKAAYSCNYKTLRLLHEKNANLTKTTGDSRRNISPLDRAREKNSELQSNLNKEREKYEILECSKEKGMGCSELKKSIATLKERIVSSELTIEFLEEVQKNKKQ